MPNSFSHRPKRRSRRAGWIKFRRLLHEHLERREVLATWSYTFQWNIFDDMTGDGFTLDDTLASDVVIEIGERKHAFFDGRGIVELDSVRQANPAHFTVTGLYDETDLAYYSGEVDQFLVTVTGPSGPLPTAALVTEVIGFDDRPYLAEAGPGFSLPSVYADDSGIIRVAEGLFVFDRALFDPPAAAGVVFEDLNMNGVREPNEVFGVGGLTIYQDTNDNQRLDIGESAESVGNDGRYSLTLGADPDGTQLRIVGDDGVNFLSAYVITTSPAGFVPRFRSNMIAQNFGIYRMSTVEGKVFDDLNGNGKQDQGETPRDNGTVFLDRNGDGVVDFNQCFDFVPVEPCGFVQPNGSYRIEQARFGDVITVRPPGIPPELFTITERLPWVVGESGQRLTDVDFGIFQNVQLGGQVYRDTNGDGIRDHYNDPFIADVDVLLDLGDDGTIDRVARTDGMGAYTFNHVPPGNNRVLPSLKNPQDQSAPTSEIGYLAQVNQSAASNYAIHFGILPSGTFQPGIVDPVQVDPPLPDPHAREKLALLQQIQDRMGALLNLSFQNKLVEKVSRLLETDSYGVPIGSLESLGNLLRILNNELIPTESDGSAFTTMKQYFGDIYHLTEQDLTRLEYLWNRGLDGVVQMLDQPGATWNSFRDGTYRVGTLVDHAVTSMLKDLDRTAHDLSSGIFRVLVEGAFGTLIDVLSPSTWAHLFVELSGYNNFLQAFDPKNKVEDRLLNYMLGVVSFVPAAELAGAGAAAIKARATAIGDYLVRDLFNGAKPGITEVVSEFYSGRLTAKVKEIAAGGKGWIQLLGEGVAIDLNFLHEAGYSAEQIAGINSASKQLSQEFGRDIYMGFRTTNMNSMRHIRNGTALPKPIDIKAKTIIDLDVQYLGFSADDIGLVGLKRPEALIRPVRARFATEESYQQVLHRYQTRTAEFAEFETKLNSGQFAHDASRGVIIEPGANKPFAGDIDPVYIKDAKGVHLTGAEYDRALEVLKNGAGQIQHGAETNIISDVMRAVEAKGIARDSAEWKAAYKKASEVQSKLELAHHNRAETIIEFTPDSGPRRGPNLDKLVIVDDVAVASTAPKSRQEFEQLLSNMGVSADEFARLTVEQRVAGLRERAASRVLHASDKAARFVNENGVSSAQLQRFTGGEVSALLDAQHYGLRVVPATAAAVSRVIIENTIAGAGRDPNQFKIEGDETRGWVIRRKDSPGPVFLDTNRDGSIAPVDALRAINSLNRQGPHALLPLDSSESYQNDTSGDDFVSPIDVLLIINFIDSRLDESGEGESNAPAVSNPLLVDDPALVQSWLTQQNIERPTRISSLASPTQAPVPACALTRTPETRPASGRMSADVKLKLHHYDQYFADLASELDAAITLKDA